jgi:hypothetical protein
VGGCGVVVDLDLDGSGAVGRFLAGERTRDGYAMCACVRGGRPVCRRGGGDCGVCGDQGSRIIQQPERSAIDRSCGDRSIEIELGGEVVVVFFCLFLGWGGSLACPRSKRDGPPNFGLSRPPLLARGSLIASRLAVCLLLEPCLALWPLGLSRAAHVLPPPPIPKGTHVLNVPYSRQVNRSIYRSLD